MWKRERVCAGGRAGELTPLLLCSDVEVQFATPAAALVAKQALEVDKELNPDRSERSLSIDGCTLIAYVASGWLWKASCRQQRGTAQKTPRLSFSTGLSVRMT